MRILLVSQNFSAADLAYRLKSEGHDVRVYVDDEQDARAYSGMLRKVKDWKKSLPWVGKEGLILFDSTGYGKIQDRLRKQGYSVVGGSAGGDRCEDDRTYGQEIFWACGMRMIPSRDFKSFDEAIAFVKAHPKPWVIKQNGHASKIYNYVGQLPDGSDVVNVLETYKKAATKRDLKKKIHLQERIFGIEIGVGRYFNGTTWVGPIEFNLEHKNLVNGDLGPKTYEMGTVMWFSDDEENPLYQKTLAKMEEYLRSIDFHGDVDINCIVNDKGVYPLEITARFGFPALQLQQALSLETKWGSFLKAVATDKQYPFKYKKGEYGVIVLVALPPFPYESSSRVQRMSHVNIFLSPDLTARDRKFIHFEEVSRRRNGQLYSSGNNGFVLHVSGVGRSVTEARRDAYGRIGKIVIPKMFYRTDIGENFEEQYTALKDWGYF